MRRCLQAIAAIAAIAVLGAVEAHAASRPTPATVARATEIPACATFVDAAKKGGDGTAAKPFGAIAAAVDAVKPGAVICVAEGVYAEEIAPGEKPFTLAGGFKRGSQFKVRDSAAHVSKAQGNGKGSFLRIVDPGPKGDALTAIDGFEITGYSQAVVRDFYESQRFDLTNNNIHDNTCAEEKLVGAGFALNNVTGTIRGNVIRNNSCDRGGAGFLNDSTNSNTVSVASNLVDGNSGTAADDSHGGGLYLFGKSLKIADNLVINNSVTQWGGGLFVGAFTPGNQFTTATLSGNVYRGNKAGDSGGGFFCDEGATCIASHEVYDGNCGGNILVDGGSGGSGPTTARFDHITVVRGLAPGCDGPGMGFQLDTYDAQAADNYTITNAVFWGNAEGKDVVATCGSKCAQLKLSIDSSMLKATPGEGVKITYGPNILAPADPLFADPGKGDFSLKPGSPAKAKGTKGSDLGALVEAVGGPAPDAAKAEIAAKAEPAESAPEPAPATQPEQAPARKAEGATPAGEPAADAPEAPEETVKKADAAAPAKEASPGPSAKPAAPSPPSPDVTVKQAFDDAKELGTVEAWTAFLETYPTGFHANLARAYLKKLGVDAPPAPASGPAPAAATPAAPAAPAPQPAVKLDEAAPAAPVEPAAEATSAPARDKPAVVRGAKFMGFPERFNRYYTDPSWKPSKTVFVSPTGGGDGASREKPMSVKDAVAGARPGTLINFTKGKYEGCFEFTKENGGSYDEPVVVFGERNEDKSLAVTMSCCGTGRKTCFNMEDADYVAVDGLELVGGTYGVRAVGLALEQSKHSRGIAVLNVDGHDQARDPFKTAQADWAVFERNIAHGAKKEDGHGIYISGGSDWNIVRFNETHSNASSDFQVNADPKSGCEDVGVPYADPRCDAFAGDGEGGQGASDYFLVEGNYFHRSEIGANFTSVRRSLVRNNIFGPQTRHNVSFWQQTDNPKLGSSENRILHNLFITTGRHGLQFLNGSNRNEVANNIVLGVKIEGGKALANPQALLMEVDDTVGGNVYRSNFYSSGRIEGRKPGGDEKAGADFSPGWFTRFPAALTHDPNDFTPSADAPFLGMGKVSAEAPADRNGTARSGAVDAGPIEVK